MRLIPSVLVYGFKKRSVEDVRKKLETAFGIELRVSRKDAEGIRYSVTNREPVLGMSLFPNHDADEDGEFFPENKFKEFPVILRVRSWEKYPNFMDIINGIPDFGAELLERFEEEELDDEEV